MNAADDDTQIELSEREEILRRMPGISDAEMPFRGDRLTREHLMREAARSERTAPSRRSKRPLFISLGVVAAACAVAVAFTLGGNGPGDHLEAAKPDPAAVQLLDRIALAAAETSAPAVRDGQFLYTKTSGHSTSLSEVAGGEMEPARTDESAEQWVSVDGSAKTMTRTAKGTEVDPQTDPGQGKPSINGPTYRFLESLPTDPDKLLELIYADTRLNHGKDSGSTTGPDQEAFVAIGDLLRTMEAPPGVSAALYRAAARIPGVVMVPDSTDSVGRAGVAVARVHKGERTEWIFDKSSLRLLGERTLLLKDSAWGKAGTPVTSVSIVARGVTDRAGQLPRQ
ncbi:CU044_5270 family protein [Streptomyces sp. NPDC048507]|uniref:CU044_5270 family protein n=1 Tax=Streptomyces sp. NPDC048507 TaxID=3365560 RepID=UPI003717D3B3